MLLNGFNGVTSVLRHNTLPFRWQTLALSLWKVLQMSVTSLALAQRGLHSEDLNAARWQRGGMSPHWKTEWLPWNKAESRRPQCRKRPHVRLRLGQRFQKKWMGLERLQRDEITNDCQWEGMAAGLFCNEPLICSVQNILKPSSSSRSTAVAPNDSVFSFRYGLLLLQRNRKYTFKLGSCNWVDKQHGAVQTRSSLELSSFRAFLTKASVKACPLCTTVHPCHEKLQAPLREFC